MVKVVLKHQISRDRSEIIQEFNATVTLGNNCVYINISHKVDWIKKVSCVDCGKELRAGYGGTHCAACLDYGDGYG